MIDNTDPILIFILRYKESLIKFNNIFCDYPQLCQYPNFIYLTGRKTDDW
jgi:hypothetical protein